MSTIKDFRDIEAWKKARILCSDIYEISNKTDLSKDYSLKDQIRRSSGSIMDNIAEGFERDGRKEFIYFLSIAKGSCGEVVSQLYRTFDQKYIDKEQFDELLDKSTEVGKMIGSFMNYLKNSEYKGKKFKTPELETN